MNEGAHVGSVEALDAFRTDLSQFITRTVQALDEAGDRAKRTRLWLENDRLPFWLQEIKKRTRRLEQAEQELHQVRLPGNRDISLQQMLVRKAGRALKEAEEKARTVRKWQQDFDSVVEPLLRPIDRLRDHISHELPKGVISLLHAADSLDAYHYDGADVGRAAPLPASSADQTPAATPLP